MKFLTKSIEAGLILMAVGTGLLAYPANMDSVKAGGTPPLISAILQEDKELYSKEMSHLLHQPMDEFKKAILFKTKKGDTIFHLMAGVKSHQEFFAQEIQALNEIFDLNKEEKNVSLGGVKIEIPYLEDTEFYQIYQVDYRVDIPFLVIANEFREMPAIKLFQQIHAKTKDGESFQEFVVGQLDPKEWKHRLRSRDAKISQYIAPPFSYMNIKNQESFCQKI